MFKNRFIGVMAVLAVVVLLAVAFSFIGVFASNPESEAGLGANEAGINAYKQSEWADYRGVPARVIEEGLAIYRQSERSSALAKPAVSNEDGLTIYRQSERHGAAASLARLYNGESFNAYQQSEWLGAER